MKKLVLIGVLALSTSAAMASPVVTLLPMPVVQAPKIQVVTNMLDGYRRLRKFWLSRTIVR